MKMTDRRRYKRLETSCLISYIFLDREGNEIDEGMGTALNLSQGGLLLETYLPVKAQFILIMYIDLEGQLVKIKGKVVHTPGHQSDEVCYQFDEKLFTGDMLFIVGIGRVDLPDSNPPDMEKSVELLKTLPDNLVVYPGHDYGDVPFRTLGEEKKMNDGYEQCNDRRFHFCESVHYSLLLQGVEWKKGLGDCRADSGVRFVCVP